MEFIANTLNKKFIKNLLPPAGTKVDGVMAAIAYGSNFPNEKEDFIADCIKNHYRLDLWMRYDHTVPVSPTLLRRILDNHKNNIFCKLIPDCLHSKVIWWHGYGAYIGSANLTERAWNSNIEAGLFLTENDLLNSGMLEELENFFESLRNINQSMDLTKELIEELEVIAKTRLGTEYLGKNLRQTPIWQGPMFDAQEPSIVKKKEAFRKEWSNTLTELRSIGDLLTINKPIWIDEDIPINWQVDQFLHAIYYNKMGKGKAKPIDELHIKNKSNPKLAVLELINWWKDTKSPPSNEDRTLYKSAPLIREYLSRDKVLLLNEHEFSEVCSSTYATRDHVAQMKLAILGIMDKKRLSTQERISLYSPWLLSQRNEKGWNILRLISYVLYEGADNNLWERLYKASHDDEYTLPHYGLNSLAEIVGWAKPDAFPPRNGRTSKALKALGFDVKIY